MACHTNVSRLLVVHQIAIDIVLKDKFRRVEPVVEDLTTHYMPSNAPAYLVAFLAQPVVTEYLRVKIMCFEGRVVHMADWSFEEEEGVVVDERSRASVNSVEGGDGAALGSVKELALDRVNNIHP